jgi:nucleotide-binding universal stress UspA family protein
MIHNILIGLDGSEFSGQAVELGIRWSRLTGAGLVGLAVVDEPNILRCEPVGAWGSYYKRRRDKALIDDAQHKVRDFLDQFAKRCEEAGAPYRTLELAGLPFERILFRAEDLDLTILGRETHFQFETQTAADQTLTKVLGHSRRPVVVVPRRLPEPRAIVLAYDAGPSAVRALNAFQASGLAGDGGPVHVVSVAADEGLARRRAEDAADFLRHHDIAAVLRPFRGERAAKFIVEEAERCGAHMIVMGAFERSALVSFFRGSVTRTLLRTAADRVLFLHQ